MEMIIKIDERTDQARAFFNYLKTLPFVELKDINKEIGISEDKNTYSEEFAEKIRQARKERLRGETIKISSENLWKIAK